MTFRGRLPDDDWQALGIGREPEPNPGPEFEPAPVPPCTEAPTRPRDVIMALLLFGGWFLFLICCP